MNQNSLIVHGSTVWATAFALEWPSAVATDIHRAVAPMAIKGEDDVSYQQGVAHIIKGGDAEDNVVDGTYGSQAAEIKKGLVQTVCGRHHQHRLY